MCDKFLPDGREGINLIDENVVLDVGIRRYRVENAYLEREYGFNVVHNYGDGGSGFTLSWGCAEDVVDLVERMDDASFRAARHISTRDATPTATPSSGNLGRGGIETYRSPFTVAEESICS